MSEAHEILLGARMPLLRAGVEGFGWEGFVVASWRGREALSTAFAYEVTVVRLARQGEVAAEDLLGRSVTLAIQSSGLWQPVHGVVAEAELASHDAKTLVYRLVLRPHAWHLALGSRCRVFVERTLEDILRAALEPCLVRAEGCGDGGVAFDGYTPPSATYRFAVGDEARLRSVSRKLVVQYNESDLAFVERILAREGWSYAFEHGARSVTLVVSDDPARTAPPATALPLAALDPRDACTTGEEVLLGLERRVGARAAIVTLRDHDWARTQVRLEASQRAPGGGVAVERYRFPAGDGHTTEAPCEGPARIENERLEAERRRCRGTSTWRAMSAGRRFVAQDRLHLEDDADLVAIEVRSVARQLTLACDEPDRALDPGDHGFLCRYTALPAAVVFRPSIDAAPRLEGLHVAVVTAEEVDEAVRPEVHADRYGRVRVRFAWDQSPSHGRPTSTWVRVARSWAGPGFGVMFTPRVGHEVLVSFLHGDAEQPVIVGSLHNVQSPPPYDAERQPNVSGIKTDSVGREGWNELRFDDTAGAEQIYLHAQRNLRERVRGSHHARVGGEEHIDVGGDRGVDVVGDHRRRVGGSDLLEVGGDHSVFAGGNGRRSVDHDDLHEVGGDRSAVVGGSDHRTVAHHDHIEVGKGRQVRVTEGRATEIGGPDSLVVHDLGRTVTVVAGDHATTAENGSVMLRAGTASAHLEAGIVRIDNGLGARLSLEGGVVKLETGMGASLVMEGNTIRLNGFVVRIEGELETDIQGGVVKLNC
jgi:type VI secretion system secreted protein VgrG